MTDAAPAKRLTVEDRLDIHELTYKYAYFIDHYQIDPLLELWTDDAVFDERPLGLRCAEGIDQIRDLFVDAFAVSTAHVHMITNHIIEAVSDSEAEGTCAALVEIDLKSGGFVHATSGYDDRYVKRQGRWLFKSRIVNPYCNVNLEGVGAALGDAMSSGSTR
jgi:ketosteroid isomerase-like protein